MVSNVKELIGKLVEEFNQHNLGGLGSLLDKDILYSESFLSKPLTGIEAVKQDWQEFFTMIPDVKFTIQNMLVEGDKAALELMYAGTQTGPISGRETPPTNRCIEMICAIFVQVNSEGLIREWREYYDTGAFYKQLGLTPES